MQGLSLHLPAKVLSTPLQFMVFRPLLQHQVPRPSLFSRLSCIILPNGKMKAFFMFEPSAWMPVR